jgi:hypothetical protein
LKPETCTAAVNWQFGAGNLELARGKHWKNRVTSSLEQIRLDSRYCVLLSLYRSP